MKQKVFSFVLAGVCAAGLAVAEPQQPGTHERGPHHRMEMLSQRLNLTADQQAKLLPIMSERRQQMRAIFQDSSLSKEDRVAKLKAVRNESNGKIEALLTDEQRQSYEQLQQQMRQRAHERRDASNPLGANTDATR
jgi:protein CpxP